jgi:hypothetical protein
MHEAEHLRQYALFSLPWHTITSAKSNASSNDAFANAVPEGASSSLLRMELDRSDAVSVMSRDSSLNEMDSNSDPKKGIIEESIREEELRAVMKAKGPTPEERNNTITAWIHATAGEPEEYPIKWLLRSFNHRK